MKTNFIKKTQKGEDLGQRMSNAFDDVLSRHEKVIIVGSDCPQLSPKIINDAFGFLDKSDLVLGPTYDGGYYLLGIKKMYPFLFSGIKWSTETVLSQTLQKAETHQLHHKLLVKLSDVDYAVDWEDHGWDL